MNEAINKAKEYLNSLAEWKSDKTNVFWKNRYRSIWICDSCESKLPLLVIREWKHKIYTTIWKRLKKCGVSSEIKEKGVMKSVKEGMSQIKWNKKLCSGKFIKRVKLLLKEELTYEQGHERKI